MNEIDKEYILNQLNDGYIDLGIHDEKEIEYLKLIVSNYDNLQSKIDKANEILNKLCVMKPWNDSEEEMRKIYRPIKNTSKQEVYKAICDLRDILKEDK